MTDLSPAQSAGGPPNGGDITFLIDSLGDTWIPNNSAISSFQGHIWGHVTDKLVYVDANGKVSPWIARAGSRTPTPPSSPCTSRTGVTFSDGTPLDAVGRRRQPRHLVRRPTGARVSTRSACSRRPTSAPRRSTRPP